MYKYLIISILYNINQLILFLKRKRKLSISSKEIKKLNVGSGLNVVPDWLNIDSGISILFAKYPRFIHKLIYNNSNIKNYLPLEEYHQILSEHEFIHHDVRYGLPFKEINFDYIYCSHFLEHLSLKEARKYLCECLRVLKNRGVLRICVPDLEYVIKLYLNSEKIKALDYFFKSEIDESNTHKFMYDYELLSNELMNIGFKNIHKCNYREGIIPDVVFLDNRSEETLFIEAEKIN